jgi:GntR family phosphonate transport system transcriptional regulator
MDEVAMISSDSGRDSQPPGGGVQRQEGVALWRQIASSLGRDIASGRYPPGSQLPTEAALSAQFGVNRHTVRRAIEEMSRGGLVRVEQGRGSFVAEDVMDYVVSSRTRFSEWVRRHNKEPSGRTLRLEEVRAEQPVATALGLRPGARVILMERLGLADGRPLSLCSHHFPAARYPGLLQALREAPTITEALSRVGVGDYVRQVSRICARLPTAAEADLLRMPRNRPVLTAENINVDREGGIVEVGLACYPTPRVQVVFEP